MTFKENINYTILANKVDKEFLKNFSSYVLINESNFDKVKEKLEFFPSRQVVFLEGFYGLKDSEIKEIINILLKQNISFINITSNVENALLGDYIIVYDLENKILEGKTDEVLKEEKTLKKIGYGLPFVVDLSIQLGFYECLDNIYYDIETLMEDLWN